MNLQGAAEDTLITIAANSGKKSVVLCDRGMPGSAAYMSGDEHQQEDEFNEILEEMGWKRDELLNRYDLVIHLETAAIDTPVYDSASTNNNARHETKEEAIEQDIKTQQAWANHHNTKLIRNRECNDPALLAEGVSAFNQKKARVVQEVFEHLGMAPPSDHKKIFTMEHVPSALLEKENIKFAQFEITRTFLVHGDRVAEKRGRGDTWSYTLTEANKDSPIGGRSTQRITRRTYCELLKQKDAARNQVKKKRTVFVIDIASEGRGVKHTIEEYYDLDFSRNGKHMEVLEVDGVGEYQPPTFLQPYICNEVKDASKVSLSTISQTNPTNLSK